MELNAYIICNPTRGIPSSPPELLKPVGGGGPWPYKPEGGPDEWTYPTIPGGEEKISKPVFLKPVTTSNKPYDDIDIPDPRPWDDKGV